MDKRHIGGVVGKYLKEQLGPVAIGALLFLLALAIPIAASAQGGCFPLPSDMVAWWPLDEMSSPANDLAGVNNSGTWMNNPTPTSGMVAGALCFDGVDDYVDVPNHPELNFGTGNFSIDAWVKRDMASPNSLPSVIVDKRDPNTGIGYSLSVSYGRLVLTMSNTNYLTTTSPVPADGKWHFVAVTVRRASGGGRFYCDGIPLNTFTPLAGNVTNTNSLRIGMGQFSGNRPWLGCIDELELCKRELSPNEIQGIYNAGNAGKCKEEGQCDLLIEKTVSPNPVASGGTVTITLTVKDVGTSACGPISGIIVADPLPVGLTTPSGVTVNVVNNPPPSAGPWTTGFSGGLIWGMNPTAFPPGYEVTFTFTATVTASPGSTIQNCSEVSNVGDADQTNNHSCVTIQVIPPVTSGAICVTKFNDLNGDGVQQYNEPLLPGWTFNVTGQNGNLVGTISTNTTPCLKVPAPGTYTVTEQVQSGWTPTTTNPQTVTVSPGQTINLTFGNHHGGKGGRIIVYMPKPCWAVGALPGTIVHIYDLSSGAEVWQGNANNSQGVFDTGCTLKCPATYKVVPINVNCAFYPESQEVILPCCPEVAKVEFTCECKK